MAEYRLVPTPKQRRMRPLDREVVEPVNENVAPVNAAQQQPVAEVVDEDDER
jgi:hypothetical protein